MNSMHAIIVFLWAKKMNANQIHFEMHPVYGKECLRSEQFMFGVRKC